MKPYLTLALALMVACGADDKPTAPPAAPTAKPAPAPAPAPGANDAPDADADAPTTVADGAAAPEAGSPEALTVPAIPDAAGDAPAADGVDGKAVFMQYCVACHGADGKGNGGLAASFVDDPARLAKSDAELSKTIKEGKQGALGMMPPWGDTLSDDQISAVLGYIRADFGK